MIFRAVRNVFPFTSCYILQELGLYRYYRGQFGDYFCCKKEKSQLNFQIQHLFPGMSLDLPVDHYNFWSEDLHRFFTASKFLLLSF